MYNIKSNARLCCNKTLAGQERFRSVTRSYYRGAAGCILVYDVTNRESYNHVSSWLADARSLASAELTIILVGNKIDLADDREVTFLEASRFAQVCLQELVCTRNYSLSLFCSASQLLLFFWKYC